MTLGLFTYSDDPAFTDREIDVEGGRWQIPTDTNNAQFVVQPYNLANHLVRYRVPPGLADSTHLFVWETNRISWQSQTGAYSAAATNLITSYVFNNAADVPQSGDEVVHLNLWLVNGIPPTDNNEVEVIIQSFNFVPLGTPPRTVLGKLQMPVAGQFKCDLSRPARLSLRSADLIEPPRVDASDNVAGDQHRPQLRGHESTGQQSLLSRRHPAMNFSELAWKSSNNRNEDYQNDLRCRVVLRGVEFDGRLKSGAGSSPTTNHAGTPSAPDHRPPAIRTRRAMSRPRNCPMAPFHRRMPTEILSSARRTTARRKWS